MTKNTICTHIFNSSGKCLREHSPLWWYSSSTSWYNTWGKTKDIYFKVLKAFYKSKRCVPGNLILLKRKSSISAIDISSYMSVNNILFIHIPQLFLSQIDIIFTYPGCPLTHLKKKFVWKKEFISGFIAHMVYLSPPLFSSCDATTSIAGGNFCTCVLLYVGCIVLLFWGKYLRAHL